MSEDFEVATKHVAALAARQELNENDLLSLYALYKCATEGPCSASSTSRPGIFNIKARRKWDAWNALGDMQQEAAAAEYVALLARLRPDWQPQAAAAGGSKQGGGGGAGAGVFSRMAEAEGEDEEGDEEQQPLHAAASSGDEAAAERLLQGGAADVDVRDGEGATALHHAADRGHVALLQLLLRHGATLDALDGEHMTPLMYACLAEQREAAECLVAAGAEVQLRSGDGQTAAQLAPESWDFLHQRT